MTTRVCKQCKEVKPVTSFYGSNWCKECVDMWVKKSIEVRVMIRDLANKFSS